MVIERFMKKINENKDPSLQTVIDRLLYLAALNFLDKHMVLFYQSGFFTNEKPANLIRETILELCKDMKDDAIALVDAMAPPDYVLDSILGHSTGEVYKNLYNSMIQSDGSFQRVTYLDDYMKPIKFGGLSKSKL